MTMGSLPGNAANAILHGRLDVHVECSGIFRMWFLFILELASGYGGGGEGGGDPM
jgi:hypothetical protein